MATGGKTKLKKTASLLREAIPKMSQLDIPLTPENYHVWYEYTMGSDPQLNVTIDTLLSNKTKFTAKINGELYSNFIKKSQDEMFRNFQLEVQTLVSKLMAKLDGMTKKTQNFSGTLEKYSSVLQEDPDIDTITGLITNLIDETGSVLEENQSMESMLDSMNEEVDSLKDNLQELSAEAMTDRLTGIPNRRAFDKKIDDLLETYEDEEEIFSVLLLDIDHFKKFNDTYGHAVGDKVLTYVASILKGAVKGDDMVARYGGEEFVILLPETPYAGALAVAENVREKIASKHLVDGTGENKQDYGYVTISVGASVIASGDSIPVLIERADKAMYMAKEQGRNKVVGEQDLG